MDELTIALLTLDFGQAWARNDFVQRVSQNLIRLWTACCTKSHTTLGNMRDLGTEFHTTLGNMLHKISYDLGQYEGT